MPKYKKCSRCDINYIQEDKEYCDICEAEMKGVTFEEVVDDEEAELCPKCRVNYLNEGETICEGCQALIDAEEKKVASRIAEEYEWDKDDNSDDATVDEDDIVMPDEVSLEGLAEEEGWEDSEDNEDNEEKSIDADMEDVLDEVDNLDDIDDDDDFDENEEDEDNQEED